MILKEGANRIRDLFDADTDKAQFGTGTTAEADTDTILETPVSDTKLSTTSTTADNFVIKTLTINSFKGNGNSISEFALQENSSGNTINRVTFTSFDKNNTMELRSKNRYFIE